ncbi:MAG: hypothetical protein MUF15_01930 [Acidobacteria bacterium]|jgi:hypothetical protein|nr:hypothetical protein [Acidobacteriota bacterium]
MLYDRKKCRLATILMVEVLAAIPAPFPGIKGFEARPIGSWHYFILLKFSSFPIFDAYIRR